MAALLMATAVPLNLFQRTRPEVMGLAPDGDDVGAHTAVRRGHAANVMDPIWVSIDWTLARALRTSRFWWVGLGFFTGLFAWYEVQVHQTKYLIEIGFAPTVAAWALGAVGLAGVVGQIGLGALSDRIGREWVWALACLGFAACYALLLALRTNPTPTLLYVMVACQGVLGYGLASVFGAIPAELFLGPHLGSIFGTLSAFAIGGGAVEPWVAGALHDHTGSYALAFWIAIGCSVVSIVAMWLAAPSKVRAVAGRIGR
jgi:MFS family permease